MNDLDPTQRQRGKDRLVPTMYSQQLPEPYAGQTYYNLPPLKSSHYHLLISSYFYVEGIGGASQILATVADLLGDERDRSIVRHGRYLALASGLISPTLLTLDLYTPQRFYNMLRIFRRTSAMSIGAWTLTSFGTLSGLTAAAQLMEDLTGNRRWRVVARVPGLPVTALTPLFTTYTAALITATNTPLWFTAGRLMPILFATSAMSTAAAALSLGEQLRRRPRLEKLETLNLIALGGELAAVAALDRRWKQQGVHGVLEEEPNRTRYRGYIALGLLAPLALHGISKLTGKRSGATSLLAAAATLAGGFLMRHVIVTAGNQSTSRAEEYFRLTQPQEEQPKTAPQVSQPQPAEEATTLEGKRQQVLELLTASLELPPAEQTDQLFQAETLLVQMRNALLEYRHRDPALSPQVQRVLPAINGSLSWVVGCKFPLTEANQQVVDESRKALAGLDLSPFTLAVSPG